MAETLRCNARPPLAEAPHRLNSARPILDHHYQKPRHSQSNVTKGRVHAVQKLQSKSQSTPGAVCTPPSETPSPSIQRTPQLDDADSSRRHSQASYASTSSSRSKKNYKTHIGPWQLGRTLGKGSSARVRLCRHSVTNQLAAVKIVNRRMAYLVQDSSLAALSKWDSSLPEQINGEMRVPMAIEREVAILKLIEHPNIMKLYDIWENRSEIYLILEYIDQGDLFTFINNKGRLSEEVAIYFFRQIISAIAYCHSFNVCHRDLKPENILITADLQIKIADFGMAALHQTATHQLATACGSPHYAAPELLKNQQYRGDRADIWSLGVILYAMLSATLPFDDPDLRVMMSRTKKGQYEMPSGLSPEAEDLIRRMLQINPDRRITLKEISRHPLVQKYGYLDKFGINNSQLPDTRKGFQHTPVPRHEIDPQLLRQLRSMWHMFSEYDLVMKLTCEQTNDQKAFYWLLHTYRNKQLEDFKPELSHSMSDYHHLKPAVWKKRISTCRFAQSRPNGHGRSVSRFTVISNTAETESETIKSYDPYRSSRVFQSSNSQTSPAKITIHHDHQISNGPCTFQSVGVCAGSNVERRARPNSVRVSIMSRPHSSRGSLSSLKSIRQGTSHGHTPTLRHKRGIDFRYARKRSNSMVGMQNPHRKAGPVQASAECSPSGIERPQSPTPDNSRIMEQSPSEIGRNRGSQKVATLLFNEELRIFSNIIAKDCDDAFNGSLAEDNSTVCSLNKTETQQRGSAPLSFNIDSPCVLTAQRELSTKSYSGRPLPPLPSQSPSPTVGRILSLSTSETKNGSERIAVEHVNRRVISVQTSKQSERRIVSAPTCTQGSRQKNVLPSIRENGGAYAMNNDKARVVSAPPHNVTKRVDDCGRGVEYLTSVANSIRLVNSSTCLSPVKIPEPLRVRRKANSGDDLGHTQQLQVAHGAEKSTRANDELYHHDPQGLMKKKKSWFRRSFRSDEADTEAVVIESRDETTDDVPNQVPPPLPGTKMDGTGTKKNFSFPFWKSTRNRESKMSIEGPENANRDEKNLDKRERKNPSHDWHDSDSGSNRNIEVKQNWLARLFRVKPATSYICMTLSRKCARQEVAIILREWRKYGIKGVQVDKQRDIVFARVGANNYLDLKEVSFAAEVMRVIEHGKKQPLSIVRLTQERGAASSFYRVVAAMKMVFGNRNLLVTERSKQKMMIKTLNA